MKSKLFLVFLILLSISMSSTVRAQVENLMPISSTDKFNYRGYLNGNVFVSNASETISEYDGNLLLAYEYSPNLPDHLKSSITLTYNANVTHSSHLKCGSNTSMHPQYVNYPEWIIGFRGFALQVLNFETNWLSEGSLGCGNPLTGSELSLIIPGYHYSDKQPDDYGYSRYSGEPPLYSNINDMIRILMADGTIKYLFNLMPGTNTKLGTYVEGAAPDRKCYAFVEDQDSDGLREMYYKMGDGYTYIFYEKPSRLWGNQGWSSSKVMYLSKVISNVGDIFTLGYDSQSGNNSSFGRYLFCGIELDRSSKGCLGQIYPSKIFQLGYNFIDFGWEDPKIAYIDLLLNEKKTSTLWMNFNDQLSFYNNDRSSQATRILQVLGISDEKNLMTEFNYSSFQRNYSYQGYATMITKPKLITSIEYPSNKKTEIEYYQEKFSGSYPNLSLDLIPTSDIDVICIDCNMTYAFRDCFTNYMVKKKKTFNGNSLISEQNFSFTFDGIFGPLSMRENYVPGIKTTINSINYQNDNSIPNQTQQTFYFSRYRTGYWDYTMQDRSFTLKKNWESITDIVSQDSHITYFVWDTLSTYELVSKTEKEFYTDDTQQLYEKNSTTNISREFSTIHFGDNNDIRIIKSESVIDPNNIVSYKSNKIFWPQSSFEIDKDFYYNIYSTDEIKDSSLNGVIKSHQKIEYYDDPQSEFLGLKKKVTNFPNLRPVVSDFEYYSTADSVYRYLLKKVNYSNGITKSFQYPKIYPGNGDENFGFWSIQDTQIVRVVSDELVEKDSMIILSMYDNCMIWNPIRTVTTDNNDNSFSSLQIQNSDREVIYSTDMQNLLSGFQYDEKSRLAQAVLPGNFCFDPFSTYDSSLVTVNLSPNISRFIYNSVVQNCSTYTISLATIPTVIGLYSRINVTEEVPHDDRMTEIIKVDSETDEGIGGGIGGGSVCNQYDRYFLMFADKIDLKNAVAIQNATFNIKTGIHDAPSGQTLIFSIKGVTDSLGTNQTVGSIDVSFIDNTTLQINVVPILEQIMNQNKDLHGFLLSCTASWINENNRYKRLDFDILSCLPNLITKITRYDFYPKNFTFKYFYDDENRIIDLNVRQGSGSLTNSILSFKSEFDPFGNTLYLKTKNSLQQYETKNSSLYNSYNLNYKSLDGENRQIFTKYDYLTRPIEIRLDTIWGTGSYKKIEYLATIDANKYPIEQITDETGKVTRKYFDKVGNLKKEERVDGSSILITLYNYDNLNRLTSVESPGHKITSYQYDDHSNIRQKTSPDEGTTKYKYDKYGNLRFQFHTSNNQLITFNKYDNFNRLTLTGQFTAGDDPNLLDPDYDYCVAGGMFEHFENINTDQGNFVLVNMYDEYLRTSVFSYLPQAFADSLSNLKGKLVATAFKDKNTNNLWSYKLYSYDHLGRVKDLYTFFQSNITYKKISSEYDNLGNLIKQNVDNQFYTWYGYDEQARLKEVRSNKNNAPTTAKLDALYSYDKSDKVLSSEFGTYGYLAPKVIYSYDGKGRISNITGIAYDVFITAFQQTLTYFNNDNIHTMFLRNDGNGSWPNLNFTYSYDNYNRLDSAVCSNPYYTETYAYDYDGNLLTKNRPYNTSQSITYNYTQPGKNYLMSLTKGLTSSNFTYDYKGNMLTDTRKLITGMTYDRRNLPVSVNKSSVYYLYNYDDAGQRIYKQTSSTNKEYYLWDHTGKELAVYDWYTGKLKMLNLYGNGLFGKVNVSYNLQNARTDSRYYYIKDYLGSVRMTIDEKTFDIVSAQDYFPFGGIMENRSYTTGGDLNDKYKFTEKERDTETNFDYFGARYYDSELGRWLQVDPLADKYPGWSPYNYCFNNPLRYIDPLGFEGWETTNSWNDDYIKKYRESVTHTMVEYSKAGREFTCEDLALSILLDFSETNNLPIIIQNGSGTFDVSSDAFNNAADFKNAVLTTTAAPDLQNSNNTSSTNIGNVKSGDMLLTRSDGSTANHVQVVRGSGSNLIGIGQGNSGWLNEVPGSSRILGAGNPNSIFYTGKELTFGMINIKSGQYNNKQTGSSISNYLNKSNIEARQWNFSKWNK